MNNPIISMIDDMD